MLRGLHYMCWHRQDWNYHPSLPMKRLQQVEEIEQMSGNLLLWSCLGSAAIGIQYLDKEANEAIPPRLRFYGHMNDREFIAECKQRGILPFAVIWKAQLWEFPAEFSEDESELLSLNKLRNVGKPGWIGMRELSTDRYPKIFPSIKNYFPDGIRDADGRPVKDFLEEFRATTLDGQPISSLWLLVPGHNHTCYTPCGNKASFMQFVRKEIEIMIDAGAPGVHIDEFDAHLHCVHNAGCFCTDCMRQFRDYLRRNPSEETKGLDLARFDYRAFLKERGYTDQDLVGTQMDLRFRIPLFKAFVRFQCDGIERNVVEIAEHVRAYSRRKTGKAALVTANMYNCLPHGTSSRPHCDYIIGEKGDMKLRQDGFYRFGRAFFGAKEGSFIEDPNGHILQIMQDLDQSRPDSYLLFRLEPLAHGFNLAVPYGAWLMNLKKDAFYPNLEVEQQLGAWLKANEALFSNDLVADTAVLYDQRSALDTELFLGGHRDAIKDAGFRAFFDVCQALSNERMLYNVLYASADEPLTAKRLAAYRQIVLPDAYSLPEGEIRLLRAWQKKGGRLVGLGKVDPRLADTRFTFHKFHDLRDHLRAAGAPVEAQEVPDLGLSLHRKGKGFTLHLVNYRLDSGTRQVAPIPSASFKLAWSPRKTVVHTFPQTDTRVTLKGDTLTVENLGIYTVVDLQ